MKLSGKLFQLNHTLIPSLGKKWEIEKTKSTTNFISTFQTDFLLTKFLRAGIGVGKKNTFFSLSGFIFQSYFDDLFNDFFLIIFFFQFSGGSIATEKVGVSSGRSKYSK